jgi:molybdopterin converting factor small subunit
VQNAFYPLFRVVEIGFVQRNDYITFRAYFYGFEAGSGVSHVLRVTVDYLGYIKQALGAKQEESVTLPDKALVRDFLCVLAEKYGEPFRKEVYDPEGNDMKPNHILSVNGVLLNQLNGVETALKDRDRVVVLPVVTGG